MAPGALRPAAPGPDPDARPAGPGHRGGVGDGSGGAAHAGRGVWQEFDLVFANAIGGPICPDNLDRDFNKLVKLSGVKHVRTHDTRHTYATLALANGENAKTVSETMGHSDVALTFRVYGHVKPEQRKALAQRMESLRMSDPAELEILG